MAPRQGAVLAPLLLADLAPALGLIQHHNGADLENTGADLENTGADLENTRADLEKGRAVLVPFLGLKQPIKSQFNNRPIGAEMTLKKQ